MTPLPPGWKQANLRRLPGSDTAYFDVPSTDIVPKFLKYLLEYHGIDVQYVKFKDGIKINIKEIK
jgi:hypothetical protein